MDISGLLMIVLIYVVPVAIGFTVLYLVVRGAVLSALRAHARDRQTNGTV